VDEWEVRCREGRPITISLVLLKFTAITLMSISGSKVLKSDLCNQI